MPDLVTQRVLDDMAAAFAAELPDEAALVRDVPGEESPTGGEPSMTEQLIAEGIPVLVELGAPGVTVNAEQLEEGTLVSARMAQPDDELAVPRRGDRLYITRWGGQRIGDSVPILVQGTAHPRSHATHLLVIGRQVRG